MAAGCAPRLPRLPVPLSAVPGTPQPRPQGLGGSDSFAGLDCSRRPQAPCGGVASLQTVFVPMCPELPRWETGRWPGFVGTVPVRGWALLALSQGGGRTCLSKLFLSLGTFDSDATNPSFYVQPSF